MKSAYQQMLEESRKVGWPAIYREDLTEHDRGFLRKRKPPCFVWLLRECGTFLFVGYPGSQGVSVHLACLIENDEQSKPESQHGYYKFEHGMLTQIKRNQAQGYLAEYCKACDDRCKRLGVDTEYFGKHGWKFYHVKLKLMQLGEQYKSSHVCFNCKRTVKRVYDLVMTRRFSPAYVVRNDYESSDLQALDKFMVTPPGHARCKKCMREWIKALGIILSTSDLELKKWKEKGTP